MGVPYINTGTAAPGAVWGTPPTGAQTLNAPWGGTKLADVISLPNYAAVVAEAIHERSQLLRSGVVVRNSALDARSGGTTVTVPTWRAINPIEESIESNNTWGQSKGGYLTPQRVTAVTQVCPILHRGFAFAADDISMLAMGVDPLNHLRMQIADAVNKVKETALFGMLNGIFGSTATGVSKLTVSVANATNAAPGNANYPSIASVIAAKAALGERGDELRVIAMNSACYYYLQQTGMLTFSSDALSTGQGIKWGGGGVGITDATVAFFGGLRVVVSDNIKPLTKAEATAAGAGAVATGATTIYPIYLFGDQALAEGVQQEMRIEGDRNILSKESVVSVDYHYGYHLFGFTWNGAAGAPTDNTAIMTPANWGLAVSDVRNAGAVRLLVQTPFDSTKYA